MTAGPVNTSDLKHNMMVATKNDILGGAGRRSHGACYEATEASNASSLAGSRVQAAGSGRHLKLCEQSKKAQIWFKFKFFLSSSSLLTYTYIRWKTIQNVT